MKFSADMVQAIAKEEFILNYPFLLVKVEEHIKEEITLGELVNVPADEDYDEFFPTQKVYFLEDRICFPYILIDGESYTVIKDDNIVAVERMDEEDVHNRVPEGFANEKIIQFNEANEATESGVET